MGHDLSFGSPNAILDAWVDFIRAKGKRWALCITKFENVVCQALASRRKLTTIWFDFKLRQTLMAYNVPLYLIKRYDIDLFVLSTVIFVVYYYIIYT